MPTPEITTQRFVSQGDVTRLGKMGMVYLRLSDEAGIYQPIRAELHRINAKEVLALGERIEALGLPSEDDEQAQIASMTLNVLEEDHLDKARELDYYGQIFLV